MKTGAYVPEENAFAKTLPLQDSGSPRSHNKRFIFQLSQNKISEIIAALTVLLFMYASVSKLLDYETFTLQLQKSPFITSYAGVLTWSLPLGEIAISALIVSKRTRLAGFYLFLFVMALFTSYIFSMFTFSSYLPCSCGGVLSKLGWIEHFWFNILFVLISIAGIFNETSIRKIQQPH